MRHAQQYIFLFFFIGACFFTLLAHAAEKKIEGENTLNTITLLAQAIKEETKAEEAPGSTSPVVPVTEDETVTEEAPGTTPPVAQVTEDETVAEEAPDTASPATQVAEEETVTEEAPGTTSPATQVAKEETVAQEAPDTTSPAPQATEEETEDADALNSITLKPETFKGDFDQMRKRRVVRFLVPYSKTFFFLDGATPRGLTYERIVAFEKKINKQIKTKHLQIHAVVIPTARKDLIPNLINGTGDVATGNLTITEERLRDADFTSPFLTGVNELLVTHRLSKTYDSIFDLAGRKIHVRMSSSYRTSLEQVNHILTEFGVAPIIIVPVNDILEDEDILEMVNAKFIDNTIIDEHKALFWAKIFPDIIIQDQIKVHTGGEIAWAIRKESPLLEDTLNDFVTHNRAGTFAGNMLLRKYLQNTKYITNALQGNNKKRYDKVIKTFEKYGKEYKIDHFMLVALAYQESQLKQSAHSESGAVGIMQILPSTASDKNVNIPNINNVDGNIHAGTKYLRFIADRYFPASEQIDELNRVLFTFAAYNAGPQKINKLRKIAKEKGYNPNIWFHNVEIIAAQKIGRETVQYVSNIFKYYIAYSLLNIANEEQYKNSPLKTFKVT